MCIGNIFSVPDNKIYDYNSECASNLLDSKKYTKVGVGVSADKDGNVYSVRLYSTTQDKIQ